MSWAAEGELLPTELLVPALAERLGPELKCEIIVDGTRAKVSLHQSGRELVGSVGPIEVRASISRSSYRSGRLVMSIHNTGREQVSAEFATLLEMSFTFDPARDLVRTRHLRGSWHYDACYPPRAFVIEEHLHASADHSKRVSIGGINAGVFSPAIQLAIGANRLHALQIGLEWSGSWANLRRLGAVDVPRRTDTELYSRLPNGIGGHHYRSGLRRATAHHPPLLHRRTFLVRN
jgi:hypothetical protein